VTKITEQSVVLSYHARTNVNPVVYTAKSSW